MSINEDIGEDMTKLTLSVKFLSSSPDESVEKPGDALRLARGKRQKSPLNSRRESTHAELVEA
jgi:hypothetical protein